MTLMADEENQAPEQPRQQAEQFEQQVAQPQIGLVAEFLVFLRYNKKWWLTPIIILLLIVGILVWLGGSGLPQIYPV
jgi:cell division protein FtsW (lipid II flippase)